jgi:hypothetical protein
VLDALFTLLFTVCFMLMAFMHKEEMDAPLRPDNQMCALSIDKLVAV